jgi:GNAT superfamily N-acetyltransferase
MIPVAPVLQLRPLQAGEREILVGPLNEALLQAPFSSPFHTATLHEQLLAPAPPTLLPVRWQRHLRLCAWRARRLEGFADIAVGLDSDSADRPDYQPLGLLRFLLLINAERANEVAAALLAAAEEFWQKTGVAQVKAFHHSTGYPSFQAGLGALPGDWAEVIRVLTGVGYHFTERFYLFSRPLDQPIEEITPLAELSLVYDGTRSDRLYQLYRRMDRIGTARLVTIDLDTPNGVVTVAKLVHLEVDSVWQGQRIGKWLLKRIINDCTIQGQRQLLAHVPHGRHVAISLFNQLGFEELNYRGYTLEKRLTQ